MAFNFLLVRRMPIISQLIIEHRHTDDMRFSNWNSYFLEKVLMSWLFNSKYNSWVSVPEQFIMGLDAHGPLENDMLNVRLATLDLVQES